MKIRAVIAGIGAAAAVTTGVVLATTTTASAQSGPHVLKFVSVVLKSDDYSPTVTAQTDTDYSTSGRLIGFDVLHFTANPASGKVRIDGAVDMSGGVIDGTLWTTTTSPTASGRVTGGTGAFRGASGTITATTESATKTLVTIVFTT